jgi:hypothetical protein
MTASLPRHPHQSLRASSQSLLSQLVRAGTHRTGGTFSEAIERNARGPLALGPAQSVVPGGSLTARRIAAEGTRHASHLDRPGVRPVAQPARVAAGSTSAPRPAAAVLYHGKRRSCQRRRIRWPGRRSARPGACELGRHGLIGRAFDWHVQWLGLQSVRLQLVRRFAERRLGLRRLVLRSSPRDLRRVVITMTSSPRAAP